ncbi:HK97 family phage prohead protease [Enterococcus thailandicus]|uniref:HK97 family phage prohead protease n=1 Tax=Enterococcus thailandicus TaxID=417368 RepID=UPI002542BFD1|nr:HK97 family phage prohead protease [Enterococcus thailandicus]MDK4352435.1 HK97 family phage prohead protease [Enterococcus thailandicus]
MIQLVKLETRSFDIKNMKTRALNDGSEATVIEGYASVFNSRTNIDGWYEEEIAPGAFTEALTQNKDVRCLFNHDWNYVLGRSSANTLVLEEDSKGLRFEVTLPNTTFANDLKESMSRGDINQCSFGFWVTGQEEDFSGELPLIRITNVDLWEVSIVPLPAYEDTEASLRSKFQEETIETVKLRKKILKRIGEFTL